MKATNSAKPGRAGNLRVAVAQMHCRPGDVQANLNLIEQYAVQAVSEGAQLVVFPETATTGYFIADQLDRLAEPEDGPSARRLSQIAAHCKIHLAVGMAVRGDDGYYDGQLLFDPAGKRLATYYKAHLFAAERDFYRAGNQLMVVDTELGKIGLSVCYDLLFPEYIRAMVDRGAELIINSTNWISNDFQRDVWDWSGAGVTALARTRALENGVWLAMTSCVGPEAQFDSIGHSCIVAPSGKVLASAARAQGIAVAEIRWQSEELDQWRAIATYRADRRPELYGKS